MRMPGGAVCGDHASQAAAATVRFSRRWPEGIRRTMVGSRKAAQSGVRGQSRQKPLNTRGGTTGIRAVSREGRPQDVTRAMLGPGVDGDPEEKHESDAVPLRF